MTLATPITATALAERAEVGRVAVSASLDAESRGTLGQFLTPAPIAVRGDRSERGEGLVEGPGVEGPEAFVDEDRFELAPAPRGDLNERQGQREARLEPLASGKRVGAPFLTGVAVGKFIGHLVREREVALLAEASRVLRSLSGDRFGFGDGFKVC